MQSQLRVLCVAYDDSFGIYEFPLRNPGAFMSTASVEILKLGHINFPPQHASPWPSVLELRSETCIINLSEAYLALPNLRCHETEERYIWDVVVKGKPLSAGIDVLEVTFDDREALLDAFLVRCVHISTWDSLSPDPERSRAQTVLDFLRGRQVLVLSFDAVDAQEGLDLWEYLHDVTPDLRCLEISIVPTSIMDITALVVSNHIIYKLYCRRTSLCVPLL